MGNVHTVRQHHHYLVQFKSRTTSPTGGGTKPCMLPLQGKFAVLQATFCDDEGQYAGEWQFQSCDCMPIACGRDGENDRVSYLAEGDLKILCEVPPDFSLYEPQYPIVVELAPGVVNYRPRPYSIGGSMMYPDSVDYNADPTPPVAHGGCKCDCRTDPGVMHFGPCC